MAPNVSLVDLLSTVHRNVVFVLALILLPACSQAIAEDFLDFNEVSRFDLTAVTDPGTAGNINPSYIGDRVAVVAWNGTNLYVAGFDQTSYKEVHSPADNRGPISIVEVQNATTPGVVASPGFNTPFGTIATSAARRGYSGLAIKGDLLAASNDQGGNSPNAIQLFDRTDNSLKWNLSASAQSRRGGSGVAFDPGFPTGDPSVGSGVAFTIFGQSRRALLNEADGTSLADFSTGLVWKPEEVSANYARDMAFDPDTGDIYVRRSNDVHKAERTGDNSAVNQQTIVDTMGNGPTVSGQHIEFMDATLFGDLLIYNDDETAGGMDLLANTIRVVDTSGTSQPIRFNYLGGGTEFSAPIGNGTYDFDYDPITQTLAVVDVWNASASIFQLGSTPTTEGDFNFDSRVDGRDFLKWQRELVDAASLTAWQNNYGEITSRPSLLQANATNVPEPTAFSIAMLILLSVGVAYNPRSLK